MNLKIGDSLPDIQLSQDGKAIYDLIGSKPFTLLLFGYPQFFNQTQIKQLKEEFGEYLDLDYVTIGNAEVYQTYEIKGKTSLLVHRDNKSIASESSDLSVIINFLTDWKKLQ